MPSSASTRRASLADESCSACTTYTVRGGSLGPRDPPDQLIGIGMYREGLVMNDLGVHRHVPAVHLHCVGAVQKLTPAGALGLETRQGGRHRVVRGGPFSDLRVSSFHPGL